MPPLALAMGCALDLDLSRNWLRRAARFSRRRNVALAHIAGVLVLSAGAIGITGAIVVGLLKPAHGFPAVLVALAALLYLWRRRRDRHLMGSWAACAAMTFALLFLSLDKLLPGYARKFSLRSQVGAQAKLIVDEKVPIACYPHRWDSVNFYLGRSDIAVYQPEERNRLIRDLKANPNTVLFVKSDHALKDFLQDLPPSLEFIPRGAHQGIVTAGLICRRPEAAASLLARR
jgi:hypothetical protein